MFDPGAEKSRISAPTGLMAGLAAETSIGGVADDHIFPNDVSGRRCRGARWEQREAVDVAADPILLDDVAAAGTDESDAEIIRNRARGRAGSDGAVPNDFASPDAIVIAIGYADAAARTSLGVGRVSRRDDFLDESVVHETHEDAAEAVLVRDELLHDRPLDRVERRSNERDPVSPHPLYEPGAFDNNLVELAVDAISFVRGELAGGHAHRARRLVGGSSHLESVKFQLDPRRSELDAWAVVRLQALDVAGQPAVVEDR